MTAAASAAAVAAAVINAVNSAASGACLHNVRLEICIRRRHDSSEPRLRGKTNKYRGRKYAICYSIGVVVAERTGGNGAAATSKTATATVEAVIVAG